MGWLIGVDVGGTFTDLYAFETASRRIVVHKVPSTPADPSQAIVAGLQGLEKRLGVDLAAMERFAHGTTVATNALIQRRGGKLALVTTKGFRDLLEIGRQIRPKVYDIQTDYPPPLVPRERRFEAAERVGSRGEVLSELTDAEVARVAAEVTAADVDGVAICLLFSFLNPSHERRLAEAIAQARPDLHVSASFEVQPEFREYERMSTTVLNAYLQPQVTRYMERLGAAVRGLAPNAAIGINQSSGGLMSIERASRFPVRTALSGPAAGVVGAAGVASRANDGDVITFDMGGTSTDVCLVRDGKAEMTTGRDVAGFPVRLPAIDIHTIGAGGGSIAWFGPDGLLKVGPQSAGADPGPACYGRGGNEATVSDANVVLGRLPTSLLGGDMTLERDAAFRVIEPIAARLGLSVEQAALGIIRIVNANMMRAIRAVSIERGHDPRPFVLMPFGGAGALHAVELAREIGMRAILVPPSPGILCAEGLVAADLKESLVATCRTPLSADLTPVERELHRLESAANQWWKGERIAEADRQSQLVVDMRYIGQNYELGVAVPSDTGLKLPPREALAALFHAEHDRSYGHHDPDAPIEVVNLRVTAIGRLADIGAPQFQGPPAAEPVGSRPVWFSGEAALESRIYWRPDLAPGTTIEGPAVIEQLDATTPIPPGYRASVDNGLNLVIGVQS
ncbi:MAG: hydantoinase/oxoprolinase family protein [Hyphomicrobiaceae bacterium]|nr:hydantoinase/oxoprolinase family protein [Hyphomicrobiaceae bacterium]